MAREYLKAEHKAVPEKRDPLDIPLDAEDGDRKKETSAAAHAYKALEGSGAKKARKTSRNKRAVQAVTADGKDDGHARGGFVENRDQEHNVRGFSPDRYNTFIPVTRDDEWSFAVVGVNQAAMDVFCGGAEPRTVEEKLMPRLGMYRTLEENEGAKPYVELIEGADGRIEVRYRLARKNGTYVGKADLLIGFVPETCAARMRALIAQGKRIVVVAHQLYWRTPGFRGGYFGRFTVHARVID